jgi:transposase
MDTIFERVGALDVHKAQVTACVRVPGPEGRAPELAEFSTTVQGLLALRDWLAAHRVTHVAMEATGVYWQPVWHILEEDFELTLCNARHVKQVPGRKTDVSDAQWLAQLMEAGLLRGSFVPPKPQRQLRALTRYRKTPSVSARPTGCTRRCKTPTSSSTASLQTSWASQAAR